MRRFARPATSLSAPTVSHRFLLSMVSRQKLQPAITKRGIVIYNNVRLVRCTTYHFLAAGKDNIIRHPSNNDTTDFELHRSHGARNRRLFCSAAAPSSSKKTRSNIQRKKTPKQLSYLGNNDTRSKPSKPKTKKTRRSSRYRRQNRTNSTNNSNVTTQPLPKFGSDSSNYENNNAGRMGSSIQYEWDDNDDRFDIPRGSNNWAGGTAAAQANFVGEGNSDSYSDSYSENMKGRRANNNKGSFLTDEFRDKQQEFCQSLEDYRLFWYLNSGKQQHQQQEQKIPSDDKFRNNDSSSSSSSFFSSDLTTALAFQHPSPNENFPWLDLSWEKMVESEDLFRRVCTSHDELFWTCASYLGELSDMNQNQNQHQHQQHQGQLHHRINHDHNKKNSSDEDSSTREEFYGIHDDDWSEQDLRQLGCEDLFTKILPSWERLRRERALLVENYRPQEENDESDSSSQEQQNFSPLDQTKNQESIAHDAAAAPLDASFKNNQWVGWLKQMITGDDQASEVPLEVPFESVNAHSDPEFAPYQRHYLKLLGQMYYDDFFTKRHKRSNPFYCYSTSEKEEGIDRKGDVSGDKNPYQKAMADWEDKRYKILENRAERMQYVVDQSLLPLIPNRNNSGTAISKPQHYLGHNDSAVDSSDRVMTEKIVKWLIRSYLDMESLSAAQQAERVYHRHPNYHKNCLWYVTISYLKVITSNNKKLASIPDLNRSQLEHELFIQLNREASIAAQRIYDLVSSDHAKGLKVKHLSTVAFAALAELPSYSRRNMKEYYDMVHTLGILKFGPKVWDALIHGESNAPQTQAHDDRSHENSSSSRRRKRKINRKMPLNDSSLVDKPSSPTVVQPTQKPHVDLSSVLNLEISSREHHILTQRVRPRHKKILKFLIQIYSTVHHLHLALRLVKVSLDLYSPHQFNDPLDRDTFHTLFRKLLKLSENKHQASISQQKKNQQNSLSSYFSESESNIKSKEFDIALGFLDSMIAEKTWFPNDDTFLILFALILYSENPGKDADRLRSRLEACRFLSDQSQRNHTLTDVTSPESSLIIHPHAESARTLGAWVVALQQHGGVLPPTEVNPSQKALAILQANRVRSSLLFPTLLHKNDSETGIDESKPNLALYKLALSICGRDKGSPEASLDAALDILRVLKTDGLLLKGNCYQALLRVVAIFTGRNALGNDLLLARVKATKTVCEAVIDEDPYYGQTQLPALQFLQKQVSFVRLHHPDIYEEYLDELGLLDHIGDESDIGDDRTKELHVNEIYEDPQQYNSAPSAPNPYKPDEDGDDLFTDLDSVLVEELEEKDGAVATEVAVEDATEEEEFKDSTRALTEEELFKFTIPILKEKLRDAGLPVSGKKAELIARLEEEFSKFTIPILKGKLRDAGLPVSGKKAELIARLLNTK